MKHSVKVDVMLQIRIWQFNTYWRFTPSLQENVTQTLAFTLEYANDNHWRKTFPYERFNKKTL